MLEGASQVAVLLIFASLTQAEKYAISHMWSVKQQDLQHDSGASFVSCHKFCARRPTFKVNVFTEMSGAINSAGTQGEQQGERQRGRSEDLIVFVRKVLLERQSAPG